jgi:cell division protein FtsW (lipid II flippase)
MAIAAFISWLITAVCGLGLVSIWLIEYDGSGPATRLPKTALVGHILFALTGMTVWTVFLFTRSGKLAWTTVAILLVVAALGITMLLRWIGVWRANRAPSPTLVPAGFQADSLQPPAPPERHFPVGLVVVHGVVAVVTLLLVLLTALDVAGA